MTPQQYEARRRFFIEGTLCVLFVALMAAATFVWSLGVEVPQ